MTAEFYVIFLFFLLASNGCGPSKTIVYFVVLDDGVFFYLFIFRALQFLYQ